MTTTTESPEATAVAVNLSTALRWRGLLVLVAFGGGGLTLLVVSVFGLVDQHLAQRIGSITIAVVLLVFAALALRRVVVRPSVWLDVRHDCLRLRGDKDAFRVDWAELAAVTLQRERRSWGRSRYWFYRLMLTPRAVGDFAEDHPELAAFFKGDRYRYDLGRIGRAGRKLDRALCAHAPTIFLGVRTR